ncbi:MAG: hypothetical protein MI746_16850 [Pseudomonadales bacterium]|nr:hypothetical protein [Pseudomonadales bacterium]
MKCEFHPGAPAAAMCDSCQIPLCGICARYIDDRVLCERCESVASIESYVEAKSRESNESRVEELITKAEQAVENTQSYESTISASPDKKEKMLMGIVIASCVFIAYQITNSLGSTSTLSQSEIMAEERTRDQIESCMLVFWEIASVLSDGGELSESLRCEDTGLPMVVADVDGDLRVSHPRPDLLGLTDIYVTRSNPVPILVE